MLRVIRRGRILSSRGFCSSCGDKTNTSSPSVTLPEEPTTCCMSGCANCVWIDYAKELTKIYEDGGSRAQKLVLEKISDPTLKVFLQMELKSLGNKPKT